MNLSFPKFLDYGTFRARKFSSMLKNHICCLIGFSFLVALCDSSANEIPLEVIHPVINDEQYTVAYPWQQGGNWRMGLVQIKGNGEINVLKTTVPNPNRELAPILTDFRTINGRHYYFASYAPFEGKHDLPYREFCEFDGSNFAEEKCLQLDNLDPHDWLMAANGDKILMFGVPRKNWSGGFFKQRPLDLVLRRYGADGAVKWEWTSDGKIPLDHGNYASLGNEIQHIRGSNNIFDLLIQKTSSKLDRYFEFSLAKLGLLDTPLCVKYLRGCFIEPLDDYIHANSLEWDRDGGIIVSSRMQSKVFKIDYATGKVLWTLGGYGAKYSDFKIKDDPLGGFSRQHSVRRLPNGNILLYDNGNMRPDMRSRAAEYRLDMKDMTATLVWEYRAPDAYPTHEFGGAVERFANGNTLITWSGSKSDYGPQGPFPVATEVNDQGHVEFEINSKSFSLVYRVWRVH
jgi:hypothetical protein